MMTDIASQPKELSPPSTSHWGGAMRPATAGVAPVPPGWAAMPPPLPTPVLPMAVLPAARPATAPAPFAQQAAIFSIAAWLFVMAASLGMHLREVRIPPTFALVLSFSLLAGLALGIIGIACAGKPRQVAIMVPGIIGVVLNGILLAMLFWATLGVMARLHQNPGAGQQTTYLPQRTYVPQQPFPPPQFPSRPPTPYIPHRFH